MPQSVNVSVVPAIIILKYKCYQAFIQGCADYQVFIQGYGGYQAFYTRFWSTRLYTIYKDTPVTSSLCKVNEVFYKVTPVTSHLYKVTGVTRLFIQGFAGYQVFIQGYGGYLIFYTRLRRLLAHYTRLRGLPGFYTMIRRLPGLYTRLRRLPEFLYKVAPVTRHFRDRGSERKPGDRRRWPKQKRQVSMYGHGQRDNTSKTVNCISLL